MADRYMWRGDHSITQNALILQLLGGGGFAAQTTSEGSASCTFTGSTAPSPQPLARSSGSATGSSEFQAI